MEIQMNIQYAYVPEVEGYVARGDNEMGYVSGVYDTVAEMMNDIQLQVECLYEEKAEEFNSLEESKGSFTRYQMPNAEFVLSEAGEVWDD
jgi:hypothetical protein